MTKELILTLLLFLLATLGVRGVVKVYEGRVLFQPDLSLEINPGLLGMEYVEVPVRSGDYWLYGWLVKAKGSDRYCVFLHGNSGNIAGRLDFVRAMAPLGMNILLVDYRGFGKSEGTPTVEGVEEDAIAMVRFLHEKGNVPLDRIVIWGRSLGGATALAAAERYPEVAGVIVESSFLSLRRVAGDLFPYVPAAFVSAGLNSAARIAKLPTPKLIIHGTADELIPVGHGQELYERAAAPKEMLLIDRGRHGDGYAVGGDPYIARIGAWLDKTLGERK